jgi:hypothetical protein
MTFLARFLPGFGDFNAKFVRVKQRKAGINTILTFIQDQIIEISTRQLAG